MIVVDVGAKLFVFNSVLYLQCCIWFVFKTSEHLETGLCLSSIFLNFRRPYNVTLLIKDFTCSSTGADGGYCKQSSSKVFVLILVKMYMCVLLEHLVEDCAWSPDGSLLLVVDAGGKLFIFSADTLQSIFSYVS